MIVTLMTARLQLEPLIGAHAPALFEALRDPSIYDFIDEEPPADVAALAARYRRWETRRSPDGTEHWLNWAVRHHATYVGTVQATVRGTTGEIAYVLARPAWGHGYAHEAVAAVLAFLADAGVRELEARVDPANLRSIALLERLGFRGDRVVEGDRIFRR